MDVTTASAVSVVLVPKQQREKVAIPTTKALFDAIDDADLTVTPLDWAWDEMGRVLSLQPREELERGQAYDLILTPRLLSEERIPLNPISETREPESFILNYRVSSDANFTVGDFEEFSDSDGDVEVESEEEVISVEPEIPGPVVLNEIYYDAVGADTDGVLFVELFGPAGKKISGYEIAFVDGSDGSIDDRIVLPDGARIPDDGFFVIADAQTGSASVSRVAEADLIDNFDPQNGPDAVQLLNAQGQLIDALGYGSGIVAAAENGLALFEGAAASDVVNGKSLERSESGKDTDNNSVDFVIRDAPSPGM